MRMKVNYIFVFVVVFLIVKTIAIAQEMELSTSKNSTFSQLFNVAATDQDVKDAIKKRPDYIDQKNESGMTPLIFAAKNGNAIRIRILLNYKANPNIQSSDAIFHTDMPIDKGNNTALHYALFFGNNRNVYEIATDLIDAGANLDIRNTSGDMPIHYLREIQTIPDRIRIFNYMVKYMQDKKEGINAQGYKGDTMIHQIVEKNDFQWLEFLVDNYKSLVRFNIKNNEGQTPYDIAVLFNRTDMMRALRPLIVPGYNR